MSDRKDAQIPEPKFIAVHIEGRTIPMPYDKVMAAVNKGYLILNDVAGKLSITTKGWFHLIDMELQ